MKKPVLEVIRFEEPDIIATSGMGFTADNFGDGTQGNGLFTFFGGTGEPKSVTTGDPKETIVQAFNNYFSGNWSYKNQPWGEVSRGDSTTSGGLWYMMIENEYYDIFPDDPMNLKKYNGTYYYRDGGFYSN